MTTATRKCPHCAGRHPADMARCPVAGRPIGGDPQMVGQFLAGRYHLVRLLGDGGMGAVFKAADQVLRRFVAIKLLHPAVAEKASSVERFQREARAAAAIGHPNIIDILDFGAEGDRPFMVMEYLRGRSLSQLLATEGRLSERRASSIAVHTLAGLSAAHTRGILHRDLKPANLMLVARLGDKDFVKICDFGFAALLSSPSVPDRSLTPARTLVGTPAYAAPERLRGDATRDPRLDVYSLGVVLYELLAGRRPFDAPTFRELVRKVRKEEPPRLRMHRPDVSPALEAVVMRALAKERDARWPSAEAFAEALFPHASVRVPFAEEQPSDSFTVEMMRIKARERVATAPRAEPSRPRAAGAVSARNREPSPEIPIEVTSAEPSIERSVASEPPPPPPSHSDVTERSASGFYRGRVVLAILRFVSSRFGERAVKALLDGMPAAARRPFDDGIDADSWVELAAVRTLVEHIDARFGDDDLHLVLETGRAAAEGAFDLIHALEPTGGAPPELLVAEMPRLLEQVVRGVRCQVRRVGRGYGRLELFEEDEPSLTLAVGLLGFLERSLQQSGADEVEVNLLSARAFDDPETLVDLSWIG